MVSSTQLTSSEFHVYLSANKIAFLTQVMSIPDLLVPSKLVKKSNCICIGRGSSQDRPEKMTGPKWQTHPHARLQVRVTEARAAGRHSSTTKASSCGDYCTRRSGRTVFTHSMLTLESQI